MASESSMAPARSPAGAVDSASTRGRARANNLPSSGRAHGQHHYGSGTATQVWNPSSNTSETEFPNLGFWVELALPYLVILDLGSTGKQLGRVPSRPATKIRRPITPRTTFPHPKKCCKCMVAELCWQRPATEEAKSQRRLKKTQRIKK